MPSRSYEDRHLIAAYARQAAVKEYAKEKEREGIASADLMIRVGKFIERLIDVLEKSDTPELKVNTHDSLHLLCLKSAEMNITMRGC